MSCAMPRPHSKPFQAAPIVIIALCSGMQKQPGVPLENTSAISSPIIKALLMLPLSGVSLPVAVLTARNMSEW